MRLRLAGRNGVYDFQCMRIDNCNAVVQFGGDVEQAVSGADHRAMRPDTLAEVEGVHDLALLQVDHPQELAVSAGAAHARISVDGHVSKLPIRRSRNFMPGDAVLGYGGHLAAFYRIDYAQSSIAFIAYEEPAARGLAAAICGIRRGRGPQTGGSKQKEN